MHYRTYDIRHRLLQADTKRLLHRNAPHRDGDRYVIVLFNKDLNYKGTSVCARSTAIRAVPPMDEPRYVQTREGDDVARTRAALMDVLRRTRLPADRCGDQAVNHPKYGDQTAHLLSFGVSQSRKSRTARASQGVYTRETENAHNRQYAALWRHRTPAEWATVCRQLTEPMKPACALREMPSAESADARSPTPWRSRRRQVMRVLLYLITLPALFAT